MLIGCASLALQSGMGILSPDHLPVLKHAPEARTFASHTPIGSEVCDEQMEQRVVCRRDRPAKTGLLWVISTTGGKMIGIFQQVISKCHTSRPGFFPQGRLLGLTSEIVIRKNAKCREIKTLSKTPHNICRYFSQA